MNDTIVIYSPKHSARLQYVLNWLFDEQLGINFRITSDATETASLPHFISYGRFLENAVSVPDSDLLWETGISPRNIVTGQWENIPTLFASEGYCLPFDIFSAIFFLLSRYEEYYNYKPDKHGRYPATESILYKNGWLERPILDEWKTQFRKLLSEKTGLPFRAGMFEYLPTYDIDIAYSYKHKGFKRTFGAYAKDITSLKTDLVLKRASVLAGKAQDPYDSFEWLLSQHRELNIKPVYFILAALSTTVFDKNISPLHPQMQELIKHLCRNGIIGIHPSYYSDTNSQLLVKEKNTLENISGKSIAISRQHYIKLQLPGTYRRLISAGITDDYSMGYATHIGFRAGTGLSFPWYDLENETSTSLHIHPFCFMDTTAQFEMKLTIDESFERLKKITELLKKTNSRLITIFHNFSLGTDKEWNGWREAYALFLNEHFGAHANH